MVVAVLSVVGEMAPAYPDALTGVIGWAACALFSPRLRVPQRIVTLALVTLGIVGIAWGTLSGHGDSSPVRGRRYCAWSTYGFRKWAAR